MNAEGTALGVPGDRGADLILATPRALATRAIWMFA